MGLCYGPILEIWFVKTRQDDCRRIREERKIGVWGEIGFVLQFSKRDELLTGSDCAWSAGDCLDRVGQDARCNDGLVRDNWDFVFHYVESWDIQMAWLSLGTGFSDELQALYRAVACAFFIRFLFQISLSLLFPA